jgi:hypothetical protein
MNNTYLEHPSEEMLERYILHHSNENELDTIETHVLACDNCVARLEDLEAYVATMREANRQLQLERAQQPVKQSVAATLLNWLSPQHMGLIGAAAVLAIILSVGPLYRSSHQDTPPMSASLSAWRGAEARTLPANHPLNVHLNAPDLTARRVWAELVDGRGRQLWHSATSVAQDSAYVTLPALAASQNYFLRLYATEDNGNRPGDLLREFAFRTN